MKEIIIRIRDDMDGSDAQETVAFRWRGVDYEIDLSLPNVAEFECDMARWVKHARVAPTEPRTTKAGRKPAGLSDTERLVKGQRRAIRAWARALGLAVPPKGHIPDGIIDAYKANHPQELIYPQVYAGHARLELLAGPVMAQDAVNGEVSASELLGRKPEGREKRNGSTDGRNGTHDYHERAGRVAKAAAIPDGKLRATIREWAKENGYSVAARGFIPNDVVAAYNDAHGLVVNGEVVS